ncbi:MAG: hypothetical protein H7840_02685 [Alphaproteobacteria bacterium]
MDKKELDKMVATNPAVDMNLLEKGLTCIDELERLGFKPAQYGLTLPYTRSPTLQQRVKVFGPSSGK